MINRISLNKNESTTDNDRGQIYLYLLKIAISANLKYGNIKQSKLIMEILPKSLKKELMNF